jgi:hypothetical protein
MIRGVTWYSEVGSRALRAASEGEPSVRINLVTTTVTETGPSEFVSTSAEPLSASISTMPSDHMSAFMCFMITDSGDKKTSGAE